MDTAPYGDEAAWSFPPASGDVVEGWLLGRGSADFKLAAAMFCHIAADLAPRAAELAGGLAVLLDVDEHTGGFGGARAHLADEAVRRRLLDTADLRVDGASAFPLPPMLSVTAFHGGQGFSATPDRVDINVDIRTTPGFDAGSAETLVRQAVAELDAELPAPTPTGVTPVAIWPPYRLTEDEQPAAALLHAAAAAGLTVRAKTAGPSNIGNLLAGEGIPATAGFGVPYEGLHGIDERAHLAELATVYAVYKGAVLALT